MEKRLPELIIGGEYAIDELLEEKNIMLKLK